MNITKNFLPLDSYNFLKKEFHSHTFPWYFNEYSVSPDTQFQFTHNFFDITDNHDGNVEDKKMSFQKREGIPLLGPILRALNPERIIRIKLNLNTQTSSIIETGMHIDYEDDRFLSSVLFFNTCDGYIKIKNNDKIYSEDNKLVTFKSNLPHTGSTTSNEKRRIVLNLIYLPK